MEINRQEVDLKVYKCGIEKKEPSHLFAPKIREHFVISFILEGSGIFYANEKSYKLKKDQGFLISPGISSHYEPNNKKNWTYIWVEFKGNNAKNYIKLASLDEKKPIFQCKEGNSIKNYFEDIIYSTKSEDGKKIKRQGVLETLLLELIKETISNVPIESKNKDKYIEKSLKFIEVNYYRNINVVEMAENIGLNKNYFSSLFKTNTGITPQEYLINFRMDKACKLLENPALIISDIAHSVGYKDALGFSKMFKKNKGVSPSKFRKTVRS